MKTQNILLEELDRYFKTICTNEEITETETRNALYNFLDYCLQKFGLDVLDYDILIHANTTLKKDNQILAWVEPSEKYENKYDVHLNKANMSICNLIEFGKLLDLFVSAAHEFKHIIQYETIPEFIYNSNDIFCNLYYEIAEATDVKDKKLLKLLLRYEQILGILSQVEKDADNFAYTVVEQLLNELKQNSNDISYISFLETSAELLNELKKQRKLLWKKYYKNYASLKKEMHKSYDYTPILN